MNHSQRYAWAAAASLILSATLVASPLQKNDKDTKADAGKPRVKLSAQPMVAISPARVVLTAELIGGANDFEEFYCPAVEWEWGDGTTSENANDCPPYEPGKTEIKRRFTVEHVFQRASIYRVQFRLKRHSKPVAYATVNVQIRAGLREGDRN